MIIQRTNKQSKGKKGTNIDAIKKDTSQFTRLYFPC